MASWGKYIETARLCFRKKKRELSGETEELTPLDTFDYYMGRGVGGEEKKIELGTLSGHGGVVGLLQAEYEPSNLAVLMRLEFSVQSQWFSG